MSYQGDDRNERESVNASSSIIRTSTDKDKPALDKPKTVAGSSTAPTTEGQLPPRPAMDLPKTSKPLPNRPIAPAAASLMSMGASLNAGYIPPAMPSYHHPVIPGYPMLRGALGPLPPQHAYPHVPFGAAAAAISASAHPKGIGQIRSTTMPAKIPGIPSHHAGQATSIPGMPGIPSHHTGQATSIPGLPSHHAGQATSISGIPSHHAGQATSIPGILSHHAGQATSIPGIPSHHPGQAISLLPQVTAGVATTSRPSSPTSTVPSTNAVASFHQQSSEYKQADMRDRGSPHVPDITRKTSSPHCSSPTVQSSGLILTNTKPNIPSPVVPIHKPGQSMMLPHFTQGHNHLALATFPQPAIAGSMQQPSSMTSVHVGLTTTQNQSKPVQPMPGPVASLAKMYGPSHLSLVPGRPGLNQSEGPASPDISRLSGKQSGPASPVTIQQHSGTSTAPSTTHVIAAPTPLQTQSVIDGRMERPHQGVTLPNTMIPSQMYPQYVFSEPPRGYPLAFPHSGFPQPLQSGMRPPHTQTTAAMQGMHILDHQSFFAAAARNLSAGNMASDALGSVTMMDGSSGNPGIYSMQIGMQQPPNLQVTVSASNPNATSPRPSILRKRTSEGLRKPTVVPYNNDAPPPVTSEPAASPRSDSTLSAPQSGQSSPKPPSVSSESGAQVEQQPQQTVTSAPTSSPSDSCTTSQPAPASPITVKKEQSEPAVRSTISTAEASSTAMVTSISSTVDKPVSLSVALPDGASPRKKPRKQNVIVTEDKYGSSVPLEEASSDDEEKKPKPPVEDPMDDDLKFILRKRPKISIFGSYKVNTKAAHNHFLKYSDVRIKEERKPTVQDIANQKGIVNRVSGWRVHHVAAQMDDLTSVEQQVLQKLFEFRESLPKPRPGQKTKYHDELIMLDELVQGNIQRSQLVAEQLADIRKVMVKVLDHRPRCMEILQKYMNKRNPKKKT